MSKKSIQVVWTIVSLLVAISMVFFLILPAFY